jgi:hypothetical protein
LNDQTIINGTIVSYFIKDPCRIGCEQYRYKELIQSTTFLIIPPIISIIWIIFGLNLIYRSSPSRIYYDA